LNTGDRAYALKFISGKYQGGEFPLTPGKEVLIGRSTELDLVLIEEMVSRKHARLIHDEQGLRLQDLGSTNGTFVNGERIQDSYIKEGDRFLIGTSIFKVITVQAATARMGSLEIKNRLEEVAAAKPKAGGGAMSGRIEEVSIPDILQLFQASKKTGVLLLLDGDREGKIHLRKGQVVYATIGGDLDLGPLKSIFRLIGWSSGTFEFKPGDEGSFDVELEESTTSLLMEGSRQLDELRRLEPELPAPGARIELVLPLGAPLRDLGGDELDVLQLALEHGELGTILDRSFASDLDTATRLASLLSRGYLRAEGR